MSELGHTPKGLPEATIGCEVLATGLVTRPVRRGGSLGSYEPPLRYLWQTKSEPNHFVAVQELIEGSELEASLKRLEVPSYALYHRTVPHFVMTSLGDCYLAATAAIGLEDIQTFSLRESIQPVDLIVSS